jgi:hypothetical protein
MTKPQDSVAEYFESQGFHWERRTEFNQDWEYYVKDNNEDWVVPVDLAAWMYQQMLDALKVPNELLRQAYQITAREEFFSLISKPHTNWSSFKEALLKELEREHKLMYPEAQKERKV